jgi:Na+-transporting NADH:ubiquinone oxidoreductase subunit NqrE
MIIGSNFYYIFFMNNEITDVLIQQFRNHTYTMWGMFLPKMSKICNIYGPIW